MQGMQRPQENASPRSVGRGWRNSEAEVGCEAHPVEPPKIARRVHPGCSVRANAKGSPRAVRCPLLGSYSKTPPRSADGEIELTEQFAERWWRQYRVNRCLVRVLGHQPVERFEGWRIVAVR